MPKSTIVPVPFERVSISEGFWSRRIDTNRAVTARVCLEQCEKTGRIDNFRRAAGRKEGAFEGKYYNDSDVYKVARAVRRKGARRTRKAARNNAPLSRLRRQLPLAGGALLAPDHNAPKSLP